MHTITPLVVYHPLMLTSSSCYSVVKSCPTLCDSIDCSTPGLPVTPYLLEFAQVHIYWVCDAIQPSHPLPPSSPFPFSLSQHQGLFSSSWWFSHKVMSDSCDSMDCSMPGSSVRRILLERILEWDTISISRASSSARDWTLVSCTVRFPDSSVGKESTYNVGDPGSIPWRGRFTGEGIGYPLQYSWASLVAQLVKNQPAMQVTWIGYSGFWPGEFHGL